MKELSLNILDIAQNSISAGSSEIEISLCEDENSLLTLVIRDNGCGMSPEILRNVTNPFYTTRTTRKVGLGIPLLKLAAEQSGGSLSIESTTRADDPENCGTCITATFYTNSIDFTPIGDIVSTICVIIQGHPEIDYVFKHVTPKFEVLLDTKELRAVLGEGISLGESEIINWISDYLSQQYNQ